MSHYSPVRNYLFLSQNARKRLLLSVETIIYWGTKVWNIEINFVFFKKTNKKLNLKTYI